MGGSKMRRAAIHIVHHACPRCGKATCGLSHSLTGNEAMRQKFAGLCSDCVTAAEELEMMKAQAAGILQKARSG